ncbi:hypothetical protein SAMN04488541_104921 [Thermoflexibacter ruber]|uniref:Uncharacterized protein n=1 Tax=Thermoflexibacter ruber TaxID=1003 RepID=A0A1I2JDT6_9BACT|nr:hypothetical protein SAMN04488541_104921 [Thermoflexibacter ruber]
MVYKIFISDLTDYYNLITYLMRIRYCTITYLLRNKSNLLNYFTNNKLMGNNIDLLLPL